MEQERWFWKLLPVPLAEFLWEKHWLLVVIVEPRAWARGLLPMPPQLLTEAEQVSSDKFPVLLMARKTK